MEVFRRDDVGSEGRGRAGGRTEVDGVTAVRRVKVVGGRKRGEGGCKTSWEEGGVEVAAGATCNG